VNQVEPLIVDAREHRPMYLLLPLRQKVAWGAFLAFVAILAAVALPRIDRAERELRIVATQALATNVRSAALFVNIVWRTSDHPTQISNADRSVEIVNGYPAAHSIDDAIWDHRGFIFYADAGLFVQADAAHPLDCSVTYQPPTTPDGGPIIVSRAGGC
jgi:hypothetical protein